MSAPLVEEGDHRCAAGREGRSSSRSRCSRRRWSSAPRRSSSSSPSLPRRCSSRRSGPPSRSSRPTRPSRPSPAAALPPVWPPRARRLRRLVDPVPLAADPRGDLEPVAGGGAVAEPDAAYLSAVEELPVARRPSGAARLLVPAARLSVARLGRAARGHAVRAGGRAGSERDAAVRPPDPVEQAPVEQAQPEPARLSRSRSRSRPRRSRHAEQAAVEEPRRTGPANRSPKKPLLKRELQPPRRSRQPARRQGGQGHGRCEACRRQRRGEAQAAEAEHLGAQPQPAAPAAARCPRQARRPARRLDPARRRARLEQRLDRAAAAGAVAAAAGAGRRRRGARARRARGGAQGVLLAAQAPAQERAARRRVEPDRRSRARAARDRRSEGVRERDPLPCPGAAADPGDRRGARPCRARRVRVDEGEPMCRVLLAFAHRDLVARHADACQKAGVKLTGIDLDAFALLRSLSEPRAADAEADPGGRRGRDRSRAHRVRGLRRPHLRLRPRARVGRRGARRRPRPFARPRRSNGPTRPSTSSSCWTTRRRARRSRARSRSRRRAQPFATSCACSARRSCRRFASTRPRPGSLAIGEILVTGGGAELPGLVEELERLVGVPVRAADPLAPRAARQEGQAAGRGRLVRRRDRPRDRELMRAVNLLPREPAGHRKRMPSGQVLLASTAPLVAAAFVYLGFSYEHAKVSDVRADRRRGARRAQRARARRHRSASAGQQLAVQRTSRFRALAGRARPPCRVGRDARPGRARAAARRLGERSSTRSRRPRPSASAAPPSAPADDHDVDHARPARRRRRRPPSAPAAATAIFSMSGYAFSNADVAQMLARLALVPSLTNVTLVSTAAIVIGNKHVVQFQLTAYDRAGAAREEPPAAADHRRARRVGRSRRDRRGLPRRPAPAQQGREACTAEFAQTQTQILSIEASRGAASSASRASQLYELSRAMPPVGRHAGHPARPLARRCGELRRQLMSVRPPRGITLPDGSSAVPLQVVWTAASRASRGSCGASGARSASAGDNAHVSSRLFLVDNVAISSNERLDGREGAGERGHRHPAARRVRLRRSVAAASRRAWSTLRPAPRHRQRPPPAHPAGGD